MRRLLWALLGVARSLLIARSSPCPLGEDTLTFEKVVALKPASSRLSPMFAHREGFGAGGLTSDCLRRCQATPHCVGVVVNYEHDACFAASAVGPSGPGRREEPLVPASDRSSYFAKMCVHGPTCERDWLVERVPGRELRGFDDRVVSAVPSRHRCQELCLHEPTFPCRSGEFDPRTRQCRLSSQDRRSQPSAFAPARVDAVDYFENLCAPATPCDYDLRRDVDLYRADAVRTALDVAQCRALCDASAEFACRSFTFSEAQGLCFLSSDDATSMGGFALRMRPGVGFYQRARCLDPVQLSCTRESMLLTMNTADPFRGRVYAGAQSGAAPCEVLGTGSRSTSLALGLLDRNCGVTEDTDGRFTSTVVIQHHPLIQQKGDRVVKLFCLFDTGNRTVTNAYKVLVGGGGPSPNRRQGIVNATAPSPNIRMRITDRAGADVAGAKLGDELFLRIQVDDDSVFGIFARNLVATSGQKDDSIVLIDNAGCPTDSGIFPALQRSEGNRGLHGRFEAFKFADDVVVRFQVTVQFCLHECAAASCENAPPSFGRRRREAEERRSDATPSPTMLPEYPLQREIIVEGIGGNAPAQSQAPSTRDRIPSNTRMVCATPTVVAAVAVAAFLVQLTAIAACVSCVALVRRDKADVDSLVHKPRATSSACGTWSRPLSPA